MIQICLWAILSDYVDERVAALVDGPDMNGA